MNELLALAEEQIDLYERDHERLLKKSLAEPTEANIALLVYLRERCDFWYQQYGKYALYQKRGRDYREAQLKAEAERLAKIEKADIEWPKEGKEGR